MRDTDVDIPRERLAESAERVLSRALDEARRWEHGLLTSEHVCLAYAQIEWDTFAQLMRDLGVNPQQILHALEEQMRRVRVAPGRELRLAPATKILFKLATLNATRAGRHVVEAADLFAAIFEDANGVAVSIVRNHGIDPETLTSRLAARVRDAEEQEEQLKKRFDLPPFLKHFATNLNHLARQDKITPLFGREREITQIVEILCHRERSNSVLLLGEPGVGKTAIAEGLARLIEFEPDRVPLRLRDCQIVNLQMNAMVAGTMLRGMFEERMQNVIREIRERPNLILFIDEVHTMVGAGSALGAPADAGNIFKSVLARGEVRIIGATTYSEYKSFIQEDEALARRFRTVHVNEPSIEDTRRILHGLRPRLERHYSVRIDDEAIETTLQMSPRYMRHLQLPDKAIGWLDTASVKAEIARRVDVTASDVVSVISASSQIPVDMVVRDVSDRFRDVEARLSESVIGQKAAIDAVARRLVLNKGPLKDGFDRPDGVLLFLGPTGVGKTELAKSVARYLFGDARRMIRVDMSEYQDGAVGVDKLIGMPRGIVGSERGGVLTNQLRDQPYSVVLLDEVEKASPAMLNLFLQAFDEGWLTDGRGKRVYLSDAIVVMTSNIGSEYFRRLTSPMGFLSRQVGVEQIQSDVLREVERRFTPEFRNRLDDVIIFQPLSRDEVRAIASLQIDRLAQQMQASGKTLTVTPPAFDQLVAEGYSLAYGARFLKRTIESRIALPISQRWNDGRVFTARVENGSIEIDVSAAPLAATA